MKKLLILFFWSSLMVSLYILVLSVGWILGLFGMALIPAIILHVYGGIKAVRRFPQLNGWLIISILSFFLFTLVRPDLDDVRGYTGFSVLMETFGMTTDRYVEGENIYFYSAGLLLILNLVANLIILFRKKPVVNDFV